MSNRPFEMTIPAGLDDAIDRVLPRAEALFVEIGQSTTVNGGICRAPFGPGEQVALDRVAEEGRLLGLGISTDLAGNLWMEWPTEDPMPGICFIGSHLDSVPQGGNFDGLAGVLAGLASVAALRELGFRPRRRIVVLGFRGEENAWFGCQHIGSRIALGLFDRRHLEQARRVDTGATLAEHLAEAGIDLGPILTGARAIDPREPHSYIELHIEQGPVLASQGKPVGVVSGLRGSIRFPSCRCVGEYGHAGTVPRHLRRDAVVAVAELVTEMNALWKQWEEDGHDLVLTFGKMATDPAMHSVTVISGQVSFSFEARSHSTQTLQGMADCLMRKAEEIGVQRGVEFSLGDLVEGAPILMDEALRQRLMTIGDEIGCAPIEIASGAQHDAGDFAEAGIRSAMIFVRNENGSHNPAEAMEMRDFREGVRLLSAALAEEAMSVRSDH